MFNTRSRFLAASIIALTSVVVACAAPGVSGSDDALPGSAAPPGSDSPGASSAPSGAVPAAMLEDVIADAASGAGVDPSEIRIVTAEAVTWSDGSLGCPEPGMMYTQALVPGYRVVVEIDGEELSFHASKSGNFAFCEEPQPPVDDGTVDR